MRDVDRYMEVIDALSKGLPPTVMVHGVEEVVTYSIQTIMCQHEEKGQLESVTNLITLAQRVIHM